MFSFDVVIYRRVVDAGISSSFDWALIIVVGITILIEAIIMLLLKYNLFKKALLDSFMINIASLAIGYVLLKIAPNLFNSYDIPGLIKLLVITIAAEFGVLYLLNRKHSAMRTFKTSIIINAVTYILFFLFIQLSGR